MLQVQHPLIQLIQKQAAPRLLLERSFLTGHAWNMRVSAVGDQSFQLQPASLLSECQRKTNTNSCQHLVADSSLCTSVPTCCFKLYTDSHQESCTRTRRLS